MKLDTKNPYRLIFWIAVATIFTSLSVAFLVGQFGRRTTDPFFTDNPTRRLSDADVAAIAIKFDDAKSNNHGRLRLGLHNDVMVLDDHICGDICPDYTVSIVHYDAEPGAACERIGGVTVDAVVPSAASIGTQSFCIPAPLAAAECRLRLEAWRKDRKEGAQSSAMPNC
ncbi:hypothetical protein [Sphingobium sp.]|uniref:hypothetical protein n=1 Tax=Sphingobium sp. TaxID=1912891 RepID=UPI0035C6D2DD